jgi:hypothetical protein
MRDQPGAVAQLVAEWFAIVVMGMLTLTLAFLLAFGCYTLLAAES